MYFLSIHVDGDCSLSKSTEDNESKIVVSNIYNITNSTNSMIAYSIGSSILDIYKKDFSNIRFVKGKYANMFVGTKKGHNIMQSISETGGIPMYPFIAFNGGESYFIMHFDKTSLLRNLEIIEKNNSVKYYDYIVVNSGDGIMDISRQLNRDINLLNLTATEKKVINEAFSHGYLDWPRTTSLDDIARKFSISKPTALFHIRNAERKILSCFITK
jgi:predicted DNA binding protein